MRDARSIPGRLVFGSVGDFASNRRLLALIMLTQAVGVLVLAYATDVIPVYVFVMVYGIPYGGVIPLLMAFRGDLFGRERFAETSGLMAPFRTIGRVGGSNICRLPL